MSKEVFVDHDLLHVHSCETGSVLYKPHVSLFLFFLFLLLLRYLQLLLVCTYVFIHSACSMLRWNITDQYMCSATSANAYGICTKDVKSSLALGEEHLAMLRNSEMLYT